MLGALVSHSAVDEASSFQNEYVKAFRLMLLARVLDEKLASLYRAGKIHGGVFLGRGQEALSVASGLLLRKGDIFAPLIRDTAGRLAFGESLLDAVRTYLGSPLGPMRGRDGNVHRGRPREGILPMISHLGAMVSVVNGALLARRLKGVNDTVGLASLGDGATSTGAFHEGINQAAVERLPLVLVIANNQYAYSTPNSRQFACESLAEKAGGYGVPVQEIDGTSLVECLDATHRAINQARSNRSPRIIVARLLRLCGHGEHDDASYIDSSHKSAPHGRDCLKVSEAWLLSQNVADADTIKAWRNEASQEVETVIAQVQREPAPDPFTENWSAISTPGLRDGYSDPDSNSGK